MRVRVRMPSMAERYQTAHALDYAVVAMKKMGMAPDHIKIIHKLAQLARRAV